MIRMLKEFANRVGYSVAGDSLFKMLENKYVVPQLTETTIKYYLETVIPHKIEVFEAGMKLKKHFHREEAGIIRQLLVHDLSKFSAFETAYATHNFKGENSQEQKDAFEFAWLHHKHNNPHHPEYWMDVNKGGDVTILEMPQHYIAEMVADWIGAGKVYGSDAKEWIPSNINKFRFAHRTAEKLAIILNDLYLMRFIYDPTTKILNFEKFTDDIDPKIMTTLAPRDYNPNDSQDYVEPMGPFDGQEQEQTDSKQITEEK